MVGLRKVLAYLLTFTLLALSLPTVNAAEETLVGKTATAKAGETSLTVRFDSPSSKWDLTKQYTLPGSRLTLLPSGETKYARSGYNLTASAAGAATIGSVNDGSNLLKLIRSEGLYSYAPAGDKTELGRFRKFNGLGLGFPAASPRGTYPQDTTQTPQQQPNNQPKSKVGKILTIIGIALLADGGATIALAPDQSECVGECTDWKAIGGLEVAAGVALTIIGVAKM